MDFSEKLIKSERIFEGKVVSLRVDTVRMPSGNLGTREIVEHPGGVGIVAVNEKGEAIMVRQYRRAIDKIIMEIPAGKMNYGEDHCACGLRELEEETGYCAKNFRYLGFIYPTPGFCGEILYIYLATGLYEGKPNPDDDEYLSCEWVPLPKLVEMIMDGELNDAKSVYGIMKVSELIRRGEKLF